MFSCISMEANSLDKYFSDVSKHGLLSRKEERSLCLQLDKKGIQAERAKEKLVLSNLRLVAKIASQFRGRGLDIEDLITEGNIGLMVSAERFNPKFENKFCTYASYWIKHHINRSIELKGKTIRMPTHAIISAGKIHKFKNKYKEEHGKEPTLEEICKATKVTKKTAKNISEVNGGTVNLDAQMPSLTGSNSTYAEIISGDGKKPDEQTLLNSDISMLNDCLKELSLKERKVLIYRFGLDGEEKETLEKVGERLNLTRERIRQIQGEALKKLKFKVNQKERIHGAY